MPRRIERKHDHVAVVTMNTNKVNAQNPAFFGDLHAAIGARIVHFEFTLAAEAADNIDFPVHLGHRDLSAGGGHWGAGGPTANALAEGRPTEQGTAEQRDKLAAFHSITSSARASTVEGASRLSALAVDKLMTNSNVTERTTGRSTGLAPLRTRPA